jgi:hypothetical protein
MSDAIELGTLVSGAAQWGARTRSLYRGGDVRENPLTLGSQGGQPELECSISVASVFRLFMTFPHF